MDLDPRVLRYFLAVAAELHFGRAAASLHISQPSLSNQIQNLERRLGTDLFVRTSRRVELTPAGRALLEEAPLALAALERAAERTRLAGVGVAGTVRLAYAPMAGYETLGAILAAAEQDSPNVTVVAKELFSAQIPGGVSAGEFDLGLSLFPEPMPGVRSALVRTEPLALLLGKDHRLARADPVPVASLRDETLLMFPRDLAPGYYDLVTAACEQSGFQPRIRSFIDPPPQAMLARLRTTQEVGVPPASFASYTAAADSGLAACRIVEPEIRVEWSVLWSARAQSAAVRRFLESAQRCARENGWLVSGSAENGGDVDARDQAAS
jgi:DNA-binding transcriptional LysR family regulator